MNFKGQSNDLVAKAARWVREHIEQGTRMRAPKSKITHQFLYRSAKLCRFGIADVVVIVMVGRSRGTKPGEPNYGSPTFHNMHPIRHIYWSTDNSIIKRVITNVLVPVERTGWTPEEAQAAMDTYDGESVTREVWGSVGTVLAYD